MMARARLVLVRGIGEKRAQKFTDEVAGRVSRGAARRRTCLVLEAESVDKRQRWVKRVAKIGRVIDCTGPNRPADVRRWIEARLARARRARGQRRVGGALRAGRRGSRPALARGREAVPVRGREGRDRRRRGERAGRADPTARALRADRGDRRAPAHERAAPGGRAHRAGRGAARAGRARSPITSAGCCAPARSGRWRRARCRSGSGLHPFAAQKLVDQARRFDLRRLRSCLDAVRSTDVALKGGLPIAPRLAIERLVLAVCA